MMRELAAEVCQLQLQWSASNTEAMKRRGKIIRDEIPNWIRGNLAQISKEMGVVGADLFANGRDGTGQKTEIPWARYASQTRSPSPQLGWYCVYLFEANGAGLYIALAHGSTTFIDGVFRPKPNAEVTEFMAWARDVLAKEIAHFPELATPISLNARTSNLGRAYERTTLLAKRYDANNLPSDDVFQSDAILFSRFLKALYEAEDLGRQPKAEPPEITAIIEFARPTARNAASMGQGIGLSAEDRRIVERHAMQKAIAILEAKGFSTRDVSAHSSYDIEASKDDARLLIEVKGTTSRGEKVLLTANEVVVQKNAYPNNGLIIVHSVDLNRNAVPTTASGGDVIVLMPWKIDDASLVATAFTYIINRVALEC